MKHFSSKDTERVVAVRSELNNFIIMSVGEVNCFDGNEI
jgi:hypothetical protein